MKAVVYNKKGKPEKLIYCDVEKPVPNDNEVLVKVIAVSANAADYRSMKMGLIPKKRIFGADIAGIVESAGKNISRFKEGDEVFGDLAGYGFGGFAGYAVAPEKLLVNKPMKLSFEEAAALPIAGLTALQAVSDKGKIQKGQKVLIIGSGGGVGTFAIQLAKYFGAEVTGVCSSKNAGQTKTLGADFVIDYTKENFLKAGKCYDLILAINGNYPVLACRKILNPGGKYFMVGGALPQIFKALAFGWLLSIGGKKIGTVSAKSHQKDLEFLANLACEGSIRPVIESKYPLERTAEAMRYLTEGHAGGKVIITM